MSDRGEMKVCGRCGEPVVFTFEFPGAEWYCVCCGWTSGIFGVPRVPATPELQARHVELLDRYEGERAERTGIPRPPKEEHPAPTCGGCGTVAEGPLVGDKPAHWYSATEKGVTRYACSTACIPQGEMAMPW